MSTAIFLTTASLADAEDVSLIDGPRFTAAVRTALSVAREAGLPADFDIALGKQDPPLAGVLAALAEADSVHVSCVNVRRLASWVAALRGAGVAV